MYFNMFGGSALLHLLAGHPRVVAAFGIAATVGLLSSPLGPGEHGGSSTYVRALNRAIASHASEEVALAHARRGAEQLGRMSAHVRHEAVQHALRACAAHCADLTPAIVEGDPQLLKDALLLYELDRVSTLHVTAPRALAHR